MKILKSNVYINEKLDIRPVTKVRLSKMKEEPSVNGKSKPFIEENNLIWNPKKMCYDCEGNVKVSEDIVAGGKLKIRFGKVDGNFDCSRNNLTTLEGAPQEVGGSFYCSHNNLTSLEGAPNKVGGGFVCNNNKLTTLEGAPKDVGGNFYCSRNNLTTLEGAPKEVSGSFYCRKNELTTLEGAPQEVIGDFYCSNNKLTSLNGAPQKVGGFFVCSGNSNLVLPKGKLSWVKGNFIK